MSTRLRCSAWPCAALALLGALLALGACNRDNPSGKAGGSDVSAAPAGAPDERCEHGVLRAVCPKCNPSLAAVFQAKGDWCQEHGFPESFCPICHPERGGKPPGTKGDDLAKSDGAPADGTKVRFKSPDVARHAGIQTVRAEERKGSGGVPALAKIAYDGTRLAEVNARAPGVVRKLLVDVGAKVKKGDPLAVIESAAVGADRSKLQAARSRVTIAQKNYERVEALSKEGIVAAKDLLDAQREVDDAKAEQAALASALSIVGASGGSGGSYTLTAPLAGVLIERAAVAGKLVGLEERLFRVVDTSAMWADLEIDERDLPLVTPDQPVVLHVDGLEGRELQGKISYLSPEVDPRTRTVRARVPLPNPDGALRANMFGQARVLAPERASVMVPGAAVQRAKTVHLVFVRLGEMEFEARRVEIGVREGNLVEISKGLRPGEEVVTTGSFLLKTETLKDSIGAGCCAAD